MSESGIDRYWREEREREEQEQRDIWHRFERAVDVTDNWNPLPRLRRTTIH